MLKGKKILIGITGSIAAYKIPLLVRLLIKSGAEVKVILSASASDFVTPLTLATLSQNPVLSDFFNEKDGSWNSHVDLGNWADIYLIAPVSARTLSKMANGLADNLLVATYLAAKCPVFFAPAMDVDMYQHPSTQNNINTLIEFGNHPIEPAEGELASGLCGAGRLREPEEILAILTDWFQKKKAFHNKSILISAGPTFEPIDPVRFIGNRSSGKMGYALANTFSDLGAHVTLISGPVELLLKNTQINLIKVNTAAEMAQACLTESDKFDVVIMAAAVADYTPKTVATAKIKKEQGQSKNIELVPTIDILKTLGEKKATSQILVGFALETDSELENAGKKLKNKNLDMIVLNSLQDKGAGFGYDTNQITILDKWGNEEKFPLKSKDEVALDIALKIIDLTKNIPS